MRFVRFMQSIVFMKKCGNVMIIYLCAFRYSKNIYSIVTMVFVCKYIRLYVCMHVSEHDSIQNIHSTDLKFSLHRVTAFNQFK